MHETLADTLHTSLSSACADYDAVVGDRCTLQRWLLMVESRLLQLRRNEVKANEIAALSSALRQARNRQLRCSGDVYDIETFNQRHAANVLRLSNYVSQQRELVKSELAETLEAESRAHLIAFFVNALEQYLSIKEQIHDQQENSKLALTGWQKRLLEDWSAVLLRHCGAYGSAPSIEEETPASPILPPPNPNFTIWSSPNHLSPISSASCSIGHPMDTRPTSPPHQPSQPTPPSPPNPRPQPAPTHEAKRRRLTLNLDVSRIHSDIAAFDKIMGGGAAGQLPNFGSELPSFRPHLPPPPAIEATNNSNGLLQVPNVLERISSINRQRSPQEAENPVPYKGYNFGLSLAVPTQSGSGHQPPVHPPPTLSAFNPQADLSSQLTFRAPPPPTTAALKAPPRPPTEETNRTRAADNRAMQKKKRLSLTAKAAMAQEGANLPQWWD